MSEYLLEILSPTPTGLALAQVPQQLTIYLYFCSPSTPVPSCNLAQTPTRTHARTHTSTVHLLISVRVYVMCVLRVKLIPQPGISCFQYENLLSYWENSVAIIFALISTKTFSSRSNTAHTVVE